MVRIGMTLAMVVLATGCAQKPKPPAATDIKADELIAQTRALMASIEKRMPECDLSAAMAADRLAILDQRAKKLATKCDEVLGTCQAHLARLHEVHVTTSLSIALMRTEPKDCGTNQEQVATWLGTLATGIDDLEQRIDRGIVERSAHMELGKIAPPVSPGKMKSSRAAPVAIKRTTVASVSRR